MNGNDNQLLPDFRRKHHGKKVVIFGAGAGGQTVYDNVTKDGFEVLYFVDNRKQGSVVCGKEVKSPYDILYEKNDTVVVVVGACQDNDAFQIIEQLQGLGLAAGAQFEQARFNDTYAPIDLIDPVLGYSRSGDIPGFRIHAGQSPRAPRILVFGGSTTDHSFGGYKSWPELLHEQCAARGLDVAVYNGAVAGYFSAQEMLKFVRDGLSLKPAVVVTFDGVNDAYQSVLPEYPMYHPYSQKAFDVMFSNTPKSSLNINNELRGVSYGVAAALPRPESWLRNLRIIKGVSSEFGIHYFPFLQPTLLYSRRAAAGSDDEKSKMIRDFYQAATGIAAAAGFIGDATAILDDVAGAYFDFVHYSETGNGHIADYVRQRLERALIGATRGSSV